MKSTICCERDKSAQPLGYDQAVEGVLRTPDGFLFGLDKQGRRGTQFKFCPFCGTPALRIDPYQGDNCERELAEQTVDGRDQKNRVWVTFSKPELVDHSLFGEVHLLATDRCHARVRHVEGMVLTVCWENLTFRKPAPEPRKAKAASTKQPKGAVDVKALFEKYVGKVDDV